ncbi:ferredoxin [Comamonas sp.]|uniref:ferredoxin n=1 Tax=Comamonas sp. TaxID=34028 RepID=UPI0000300D61|nr:ferredoxin [Comamonas sp.]MPT10263.1 ferredoxin [Comamonas sp.]
MQHQYVILTDKDGQFRTELCEGLIPVESYDYLFYGKRRARFVIAGLLHPVRVTLIEETPPFVRNLVPSKFLPCFTSVQAARDELQQLISFGHIDAQLCRVDASAKATS